jgi:DNA-binding CsgD family transcriptional regulator
MPAVHLRITEFRPVKPLTPREAECLPHLLVCASYDELAAALGCSRHTAAMHVRHIADKLPGVSDPLFRAMRYAVVVACEAEHAARQGRAA